MDVIKALIVNINGIVNVAIIDPINYASGGEGISGVGILLMLLWCDG